MKQQNSAVRARKRRDLFTLLGAMALLIAVIIGWRIISARSEEKRAEALAGVPEFPHPGQVTVRREANQKLPIKSAPKPFDAGAAIAAPRKFDRMNAFVLAPASTVTLVHVNALFNTPLFDRFRECAPPQLKQAEDEAKKHGIDLERDIDQVAMVPGGVAISGFFEGKPVAQTISQWRNDTPPQTSTYRDQTIYEMNSGACAVQIGNMLLIGPATEDGCEPLIDRALDPPDDEDGANDLYGDIYMRSDLSGINSAASNSDSPQADAFAQVFGALSGATVRANVWDDVAVSFEGDPKSPEQLHDLSNMARGALSVARGQVDDDDSSQALADLANVKSGDGKLKIDLALPADQLFSRFHIPCPGMADGGAGNN